MSEPQPTPAPPQPMPYAQRLPVATGPVISGEIVAPPAELVPVGPTPLPGRGDLVPTSGDVPAPDGASGGKPRKPKVVVRATPGRGLSNRTAIIFAVISLLLAGGAITLYLTRSDAAVQPATRGTPENAVREFLTAVFLSHNASRLAPVVCGSWDPAEALARTTSLVPEQAHVSWDNLSVVSSQPDRITMLARLGLRMPDDVHPSAYQQWHFTVVDENGWRVCDASPIAT